MILACNASNCAPSISRNIKASLMSVSFLFSNESRVENPSDQILSPNSNANPGVNTISGVCLATSSFIADSAAPYFAKLRRTSIRFNNASDCRLFNLPAVFSNAFCAINISSTLCGFSLIPLNFSIDNPTFAARFT